MSAAVYGLTDLPANFQSRVRVDEATECWHWIGNRIKGKSSCYKPPKSEGGEPGRGTTARKYAYTKLVKVPRLRLIATCRNEDCVYPGHAKEATDKTIKRLSRNCYDAGWRARVTIGRRKAAAGSAEEGMQLAREIRRRLAAGEKPNDIAADVGRSRHMVSRIGRGKNWCEAPASALAMLVEQQVCA